MGYYFTCKAKGDIRVGNGSFGNVKLTIDQGSDDSISIENHLIKKDKLKHVLFHIY